MAQGNGPPQGPISGPLRAGGKKGKIPAKKFLDGAAGFRVNSPHGLPQGASSRKERQAMLSLKHSFLFVHIPKTAGNSIQSVLSAYSEDRIVCRKPEQDGVERFAVQSDRFNTRKHSTLQEYRAELPDDLFRTVFKFTCVRNPWDRMISFYFSPSRETASWNREGFVKLVAEVPPIPHFTSLAETQSNDRRPFDAIDYYIRFEHVNEGFKEVCERLDIPFVPLPKRNASKRRHYAFYYDEELVELVRKRFAEEIAFLGYEFERP